MTSPSRAPSSSPSGVSSDIVGRRDSASSITRSTEIPISVASSSGAGMRPSRASSRLRAQCSCDSASFAWTGSRIMRDLSATARETAWRIHHTA